ncbi:MAG: peptide ABC transporter substrate-binding protein [Dehalococcoidales bacterium]|nr:peptide ABC transporter substrate-binding protein [Dehalococcoidales bacterium]
MSYKFISLLFAVALLLSLLAGCKHQDETRTPPDNNDVLTLYGIDPHTLDPAISGDSTSHQYVTQLYSGLFRLNDQMEPRPDIAREWKVSSDGTTYTFYLREDVKFHDGTPVTAADFKYSWERTCSPDTGSQTADTYLGDITGVSSMIAGEADEISGVRVIDDYTLEVTIDAPRSYFLYKLTYPTTFIVDKDNIASGDDWWHEPNGTGPFKLGEWIEGERLVLKWNDLYYGEWPELSAVEFLLWGGVPIIMYETGEIDVTSVPVSYIDRVTDPSEQFYNELNIFPELSFYYLGFNTGEPPFDDKNIRKAFSIAIDREKITTLIFRDMVEPACGIIPPGMPGYDIITSGNSFDPEEALELIKASKYGDVSNLPPITLTTGGWGGIIANELEAIIDQWQKNLGIEIKVRQLEPDRYIYNLYDEKDQLFDIGWIADYPHPQDFLSVLFYSGVKNNYGGYSSPEVDSLLDEAGREQDTAASFEMYRQAEEILVDDTACAPLWYGENYYLVKPYVSGFFVNPLGVVMLDEVGIDKD